jgi:hypothetical protein
MNGSKTTSRKAERPSYENKAVVAAAPDRPHYVRIRVIKAHDGLQRGQILSRPYATAAEMQRLGYWKII